VKYSVVLTALLVLASYSASSNAQGVTPLAPTLGHGDSIHGAAGPVGAPGRHQGGDAEVTPLAGHQGARRS
jgi:hypothetical protein